MTWTGRGDQQGFLRSRFPEDNLGGVTDDASGVHSRGEDQGVLLGESQVCGEARCQREWQGVPWGLCIYWSPGSWSFLGVSV